MSWFTDLPVFKIIKNVQFKAVIYGILHNGIIKPKNRELLAFSIPLRRDQTASQRDLDPGSRFRISVFCKHTNQAFKKHWQIRDKPIISNSHHK